MKREWWKTFYDRKMGDELFASDRFAVAEAEVDSVIRRTGLKPGMRILDLACGYGRHSLELACRGYEVVGLDYSEQYVRRAQKLARQLKLQKNVSFIQGDMRQAAQVLRSEKFDAVLSLWNSFGYFEKRSDDVKVLRAIARLLKPGGALVLNSLNLPGTRFRLKTVSGYLGTDSLTQGGTDGEGRYWLTDSYFDARRNRVHALWHFIDLGRKQLRLEEIGQNVYSPQEYRKMLVNQGLRMTRLWGPLTGAKYSARSWQLTFVARKI